MSILNDVLKELWKMFVADARLTGALLVLVALAAALRHSPAGAELLLVIGTPAILLAFVALAAWRAK